MENEKAELPVAGTQPTPYKNGDAQKWFEDYCYEHHINFAKRIETGGEDSKRLDELVPEILEAFLAQFFPQGTPQVEEIAQQFVHIVFPSMDADCARRYIQEGAALLREHGVGAPAQPGPLPCRTPGAIYHFKLATQTESNRQILTLHVYMPHGISILEEQAEAIENRLHDACEAILAEYWRTLRAGTASLFSCALHRQRFKGSERRP